MKKLSLKTNLPMLTSLKERKPPSFFDFLVKYKKAVISLIAIILGIIAASILMIISGNNPLAGFYYLFHGSTRNIEQIGNTLATATPLILTGLSVAFAFRTGLFNIGASGQMFFGGFCAIVMGLSVNLPQIIMLPLMFIAAVLGGALWGFIPGLLKAKFNVHEVVSTIMMNWIAFWVVKYSIMTWFVGSYDTESRYLPEAATLKTGWLNSIFGNYSFINLGIFVAIITVFVIAVILNKTTLGFELKAAGFNRYAAEYAGMKVNRNIVLSMAVSGGLAGLAGLTHYTGFTSNMQVTDLIPHGFAGIAIALIGANAPWGVLFTGLFFGLMQSGRGFMEANTSIPREISDVIIALILYFAATSILIENFMDKALKRIKKKHSLEEKTEKEKITAEEEQK